MGRKLSSIIIASILAASSAYAATCPSGIDALRKESDALDASFAAADKAKDSSARPSEDEAKDLIACLQPFADSETESKHDRATAYMELSGLWGFMLNDYSSSLGDKKVSGTASWKDITEAVALDPQSELNNVVQAQGLIGMRKQSGFDKIFIQKNLGINLNNEKNDCIERLENISLTPSGQQVLDQLKKS